MIVHNNVSEPWQVTLVDTGLNTMTGGRIKRIQKYIGNETFMMTYGDGVCDINVRDLLRFHKSHGKIVTLTAAAVGQRFGVLDIVEDNRVVAFREKNMDDGARVNAGYMVLEPEIFDFIEGDHIIFERDPLQRAADMDELRAYMFDGYWQCMDTKREMDKLNYLWEMGEAPWKSWE